MNILIHRLILAAALSLIARGTWFLAFLIRYKWTGQAEYDARLKSATSAHLATDEEWLEWARRQQTRR